MNKPELIAAILKLDEEADVDGKKVPELQALYDELTSKEKEEVPKKEETTSDDEKIDSPLEEEVDEEIKKQVEEEEPSLKEKLNSNAGLIILNGVAAGVCANPNLDPRRGYTGHEQIAKSIIEVTKLVIDEIDNID